MNQVAGIARKKKVLIIDDEDELRDLLQLKFTHEGFDVTLAATGEEAKELLLKCTYSAILCDLNLPKSPKGRELFQLCSDIADPPLFILITGYTLDSPEVAAARQSGLKHIYSKPLRLKNIFQLISDSA